MRDHELESIEAAIARTVDNIKRERAALRRLCLELLAHLCSRRQERNRDAA